MAVTIHIYYTGTNGNAKKFAEEMLSAGIVNEIRADEGNVKYEYYLPLDDCETVLLIDSWKSQEALDRHHAAPRMQTILKLREKYDLRMRVERFVADENGVPEADRAFIKA